MKPDYIEKDSNGNVVKETYLAKDGGVASTTEYEYNDKNLVTGTKTYDRWGTVTTSKTEYEYDMLGNVSKDKYTLYDSNGMVKNVKTQEYDPYSHKVLRSTEKGSDGSYAIVERNYDGSVNKYDAYRRNGTIRETAKYNSAGQETLKITYDEEGKVLSNKESVFNSDGTPHWTTTRDGAGQVVESEMWGINGEKHTSKFEYDDAGRLVKDSYNDNDVNKVREYIYNEEDCVVEQRNYVDGKLDYTKVNGYDEAGKLITETYYESDGSISGYAEYNAAGDRIVSKSYKDGELESYTEFAYDDAGNLASIKTRNASGHIEYQETSAEMVFGGKTYTFNATELNNISMSLGTSGETISKKLGGIANACSSAGGLVAGANAGLSSRLSALAESCNSCSSAINNVLSGLQKNINEYVQQTLANEETAASEEASYGDEIDDINSILGGITGGY